MMSFFLLCFKFSLNYISLTHSLKTTLQALKREEQSSLSPQTTKGQRTRKNILICARKVFARAGYVTLRMSDVAEESGVSMGALYRYFQNKDDLFVNLIGDIHEQMFQASRAQEHDFAMRPVMRELFSSRLFFSAEARHAIIKSPLELVLGACRALEVRPNLKEVNRVSAQLGQSIFEPPTVKGWEGGRLWINSASLLQRNNFAMALLEGKMGSIAKLSKNVTPYRELLLAREVSGLKEFEDEPQRLVHLMMTLPEFQLI
jgi:AcrR family transcriptional regulator